MMVKLFLVVLSVLAILHQASSSTLQRDFSVDQSPKLEFQDVLTHIRNTDIRGETVKLVFRSSDETVSDLATLLETKSSPEVAEILDIFNQNFGTRLLVINGENVQINPSNYQRFLQNQARSLVRTVFPKNVMQQILVYSVLQQEIQRVVKDIRPDIESRKIPVEKMTALVVSNGHQISKRSLIDDVLSAAGEAICNTVVSAAYSSLNSSLTSVITFLDTITVDGDSSILTYLVSFLVDLASTAVEGLREVVESFTESICSDIFSSSRKRRDLADTAALAEIGTRDVLTRSIFSSLFDIIWNLLSPILNSTLTSIAASLISYVVTLVTDFLEGTVTDWVDSLIDSIFS